MAQKIENEYFQFIITYYERSGLKNSSKFLQKLVSVYILYPSLLIFYCLVLINFRNKHSDIFEIVEVFGSVSSFANLVSRKTVLLLDRPLFDDIIKELASFWKYDKFEKNAGDKYRKKMAFCVSFIKFIWISGAISLTFHSSAPLLVKEMTLPQACWIPGDIFVLRVIIYVLEVIFFIEVVFLLGVFDGFYFMMCTELTIQLELLNDAICCIKIGSDYQMSHKETWKKLVECSCYHKFLLSMHKKLNEAFSEFFVCQYFLTVGGTCISLFLISDESSTIAQIVEAIFIIVILNMLIAMVFIPASLVEIEAEKLSLQIYNLDWYNAKCNKIPKFILFWLAQTQNPVQMTGGGILKINRPTLLQIQRIGFSVSSLLAGLK